MKKLKKGKPIQAKTENEDDSGSILSKVKPVAETEAYVTSLFYGRSGTGKTTLASTFPKKILLLDFRDRGIDSIKDVAGIDVFNIKEWVEVESIYWSLLKKSSQYKTIVLDTISGMQNLAIHEVKVQEGQDDSENLSKRGWGMVSSLLNQWLLNYRDLPFHIVFLAPDRVRNIVVSEDEEIELEEGELEPEVGPSLIPSVAKSVNAAVKVIGNTFIKQVNQEDEGNTGKIHKIYQYRLRIGPHPYYITKIRSPRSFTTPASLNNPNFDKIVKIMKGEKGK
jgi:hypothetical protein